MTIYSPSPCFMLLTLKTVHLELWLLQNAIIGHHMLKIKFTNQQFDKIIVNVQKN